MRAWQRPSSEAIDAGKWNGAKLVQQCKFQYQGVRGGKRCRQRSVVRRGKKLYHHTRPRCRSVVPFRNKHLLLLCFFSEITHSPNNPSRPVQRTPLTSRLHDGAGPESIPNPRVHTLPTTKLSRAIHATAAGSHLELIHTRTQSHGRRLSA